MGGAAMSLVLRLLGAVLLVTAGAGGGLAVYKRSYARWRQLHTFARMLGYLQGTLAYQPLRAEELLRRAAAYPEFARLGAAGCRTLAELPLPGALAPALCQEVRQGLEQLAWEPRAGACATLRRLTALCEDAAAQCRREAQAARSLWPRLGACAGVLAVILLW